MKLIKKVLLLLSPYILKSKVKLTSASGSYQVILESSFSLLRILNDCNILTMLCFSSQNNIFVYLCIPIILQRTKQRSILILECLLWAPYCPTPGWPKGERRTCQLREKKDGHGWGLRRRWRIEGMSCEALRDPYALMAQASDTNCCIWLRSRLNWVSLL